jgi:hypothetical protein
MKPEDQKKYDFDNFLKIFPHIKLLVDRVELSDEITEYQFNKIQFLLRANKESKAIEMSLASEKPIFPTVVFAEPAAGEPELLYFRVNYDEFSKALREAID